MSSYISAMMDRKRDVVVVWERDEDGVRIEQLYDAPYYFYVDDDKGKYQTIFGTRVRKVEYQTGREYYQARKDFDAKGVRMWESDISPELRILSNHYYGVPAPKLNVTLLDIEVDFDPDIGFSSTRNPYAPINAITMYHTHQNRMVVIAVPPPNDGIHWTTDLLAAACDDILEVPKTYQTDYYLCNNEKELLLLIVKEIQDSDLLCGWNSETFDFPYIAKRFEKVLGENSLRYLSFPGAEIAKFEEIDTKYGPQIKLITSGRCLADYMALYKKYEFGERPSYKLSAISDETLVDKQGNPTLPKLEYEGNLADLYTGAWKPSPDYKPDPSDKLACAAVKREKLRREIEKRGLKIPSR